MILITFVSIYKNCAIRGFLLKISIITTSYNYGQYISETIESVIAQTYQDWEMIIVDDGSSDNSVSLIQSYCQKDSRIKLFSHENHVNKGLKETLRLGLKQAQNDWIVFLESDDSITPDYLEKKVAVIKKHPDVKFIINDVNLIGDDSAKQRLNRHFKIINKVLKNKHQPLDLSSCLMKRNYIVTFSTVMLNKGVLENVDFNSPVPPLLDYYIWAQIANKYKFYYLDEKLTNWRIHSDSYIKNARGFDTKSYLEFNLNKTRFICKGKNNLLYWYYCLYYRWNSIRKLILKIHLKDKSLCVLGKWYQW